MSRRWRQLGVYFGFSEPEDEDSPLTPYEVRDGARQSLRNPLWWLCIFGVGLALGGTYEAIAAAVGDGNFNLSAVPRAAFPAVLAPVAMTLADALRRAAP